MGGSNPFGAGRDGAIAALHKARAPSRIGGLALIPLRPVAMSRISGTGH